MKKKTLVLLTTGYPYGSGEPFLESEIIHLSKEFEKILILTVNNDEEITRPINEKIILDKIQFKMNFIAKTIFSLKLFFSKIFYNELKFIWNDEALHFSFFKIKVLVSSFINGNFIKQEVLTKISKGKLSLENCVFYSYWLDDSAIALALLVKENTTVKALSRTHRWDLYYEENPEDYLPLRSFVLNKIRCFSISEEGQSYLSNKLKLENVKISRLGTKKLQKSPYNFFKTEKLILSCSNVVPVKRVALIVESLSKLQNQNIKWVHFGGGPLYDEVKALANKVDLNFEMKGNQPNKILLKYLQTEPIDLFINLSSSEGIPVSIMEAASCGIPTVATNVGGTSEIVNNMNGILLESNPSAEDVSKKISNYFSLSQLEIQTIRNAAYNTWEKKFNAEKNYTEFAETISNL